jgi:hypothetical protein
MKQMGMGGVVSIDNAIVLKELQWRLMPQGLMRSYTVVDMFPLSEFLIQFRDGPGTLIHLVKLLCMGSMRPFHRPIELRTLRRQDK